MENNGQSGQAPEDAQPTQEMPAADQAHTEQLPATAEEHTEQFPAADQPAPRGGFFRRHALATSLTGAALAIVIAAGGAWGLSAANADSSTPVPAATSTPAPSATHAAKAAHRHVRVLRGTISAIDGDSWTVHTGSGKTVTVKLTAKTAFGTAKHTATRSSFAVGNRIGITFADRDGATVTARRIVHLAAAKHHRASTTTPAPTAPATPSS